MQISSVSTQDLQFEWSIRIKNGKISSWSQKQQSRTEDGQETATEADS